MTRWTAPYKDAGRVIPYGMLGICAVVAVAMVGMVATQTRSAVAALIVAPLPGMLLALMWRFARTGLVVSDAGVRVRWLLHTRTFGWDQVRRFHTARDILAPGSLWIELIDGRQVRPPVQRVRRMFFGSMLADGGAWLTPDRYEALLHTLYSRLGRSGEQGPVAAL